MQELKLAFYVGRKSRNPKATALDRLICFFTKSAYSHVELVYDLDHKTMRAKAWSSSPQDGGVRKASIHLHPQRWEVYTLEGVYTTEQLHEWFVAQEGKKYDWLGAVGAKFKVFKQHRNKWFCSEIIASYLGLKRPHRMSPIKLYHHLSPKLKRVQHPKH